MGKRTRGDRFDRIDGERAAAEGIVSTEQGESGDGIGADDLSASGLLDGTAGFNVFVGSIESAGVEGVACGRVTGDDQCAGSVGAAILGVEAVLAVWAGQSEGEICGRIGAACLEKRSIGGSSDIFLRRGKVSRSREIVGAVVDFEIAGRAGDGIGTATEIVCAFDEKSATRDDVGPAVLINLAQASAARIEGFRIGGQGVCADDEVRYFGGRIEIKGIEGDGRPGVVVGDAGIRGEADDGAVAVGGDARGAPRACRAPISGLG